MYYRMIITYNYNGTVSADILFSSYCVCMEGEIFSSNFLLVNVVDFMSISEGNERRHWHIYSAIDSLFQCCCAVADFLVWLCFVNLKCISKVVIDLSGFKLHIGPWQIINCNSQISEPYLSIGINRLIC